MNNRPPVSEALPSTGWTNWFNQVFLCLPWKRGFNVTEALDFPNVLLQAQQALTVSVVGARIGDAVLVTGADVSGLIFTGAVTADDTVTVYAKNFTAGNINPASQTFRIIVLQN